MTQFKALEEINYLETDYGFDLLALTDCILAYVMKSDVCARLLKDYGVQGDCVKIQIAKIT